MLDYAAVITSLPHQPTIARQRLRCTQREVSPAHDIARLVRQGLAEVCTIPVLLLTYVTGVSLWGKCPLMAESYPYLQDSSNNRDQ